MKKAALATSLKQGELSATIVQETSLQSPEAKALGLQNINSQTIADLRSSINDDSPDFDKFPKRASLPFTNSLRALANRSVSRLSQPGDSDRFKTQLPTQGMHSPNRQ